MDGGLMITASHNPPEFNGLKVMANDGVEVSRDTETQIEDLHFKGGPKPVNWDKVGTVTHHDVIESYLDALTKHVDKDKIKKSGLTIALDLGNGVSTLTAPILASRLGCNVYTLNTEIDGRFPGRGSEPRVDNLNGLKDLINASHADIGIGFDGDGDRSLIMNEKGGCVWGDMSLGLVAREFLQSNPGETLVTPVSSSRLLEEVVSEGGGNIHWTRVGSVDVSRIMVEKAYLLGGEENGGIMYGPHHPVRDGTMTMALILNIIARHGKPLSELILELPQYPKIKVGVWCPNHLKQSVLESIRVKAVAPKVDTTDGLKLFFPDDSWILVRPSGTEPKYRLYAEAQTEKRVNELVDEFKELITNEIESMS
jgi:phosphomannomutase/phosphoglucomutase